MIGYTARFDRDRCNKRVYVNSFFFKFSFRALGAGGRPRQAPVQPRTDRDRARDTSAPARDPCGTRVPAERPTRVPARNGPSARAHSKEVTQQQHARATNADALTITVPAPLAASPATCRFAPRSPYTRGNGAAPASASHRRHQAISIRQFDPDTCSEPAKSRHDFPPFAHSHPNDTCITTPSIQSERLAPTAQPCVHPPRVVLAPRRRRPSQERMQAIIYVCVLRAN